MVLNAMARFAAGASVPVFSVVGAGARPQVQDLWLGERIQLVGSPRPANVLLLAGALPGPLLNAAVAAHDAMSHPRVTIRWPLGTAPGTPDPFAGALVVREHEHVVDIVVRAHRELLLGSRKSEPALLPDEDPAPWRGVGPFGQGGTGMTGGVPYGRPLARRADDRDALALDQIAVRVGPLFAHFPPGLSVDLGLQGDVIQALTVDPNPFEPTGGQANYLMRPFFEALDRPVLIAEMEMARAQRHLRWLAQALLALGLEAFARRVLVLARSLRAGDAGRVRAVGGALRRTMALGWATAGIGKIEGELLEEMGAGPVARASGVAEDARAEDTAYRALGFEPIVQSEGDARARWQQRIEEAAQALELAARAGEAVSGGRGLVEAPGGRLHADSAPTARLLPLLPQLLVGREWGEAITTLVSLDLDLEDEAAAAALRVTEPAA